MSLAAYVRTYKLVYDLVMIRCWCVAACMLAACHRSESLPPEAWTVSDYASAGLDIAKPWTADDHAKAQRTLAAVTRDHRERLPRFNGVRSGAVFAKLLEDPPDDMSSPVDARLLAHLARFDALKETASLYSTDALAPPPREWIELMGHDLVQAAVLEHDADAFIASLGPDDPKHAVRIAEQEKMSSGFATMIVGGLLVADQLRLAEDDRVTMLGYVTTALPAIFPRATPEQQVQIREVIEKQVAAFPSGPLRTAAEAARRALPPQR